MRKKGLGFYLRIYRKILAQDIKSKMSYRADLIISTIGMICTNVAGFISFWILFRNFPSVSGWNYYEMLFLYGFSLILSHRQYQTHPFLVLLPHLPEPVSAFSTACPTQHPCNPANQIMHTYQYSSVSSTLSLMYS